MTEKKRKLIPGNPEIGRKKKPAPRNIAPASQEVQDKYRNTHFTPNPKEEGHSDSETQLATSDEEELEVQKISVTLADGIIQCEQGSCKEDATYYVETLDPKDDDPDQEPSFFPACHKHANKKKFLGFHIARIASMEEGIAKHEEMMPSADALERMEPEQRPTLKYTQRIITEHARRKMAEDTDKVQGSQSKDNPAEFEVKDFDREFPTLHPYKKMRVEVSGVLIPDTYPTPTDNIPSQLVTNPKSLYKRLEYKLQQNPETIVIPDIPEKVTQVTQTDKAFGETRDLETIIIPDTPDIVTQTVTQTEKKAEETATGSEPPTMEELHARSEELRRTGVLPQTRELEAAEREEVTDESDLPTLEELNIILDETRQKRRDQMITQEAFVFAMEQLEILRIRRIQFNIRNSADDIHMEVVQSTPTQEPQEKQVPSLADSINTAKSLLKQAHNVTHDIMDHVADNLYALEDKAHEQGLITPVPTSIPLYSKIVATEATKEKGEDNEEDLADSESEDELESEIMARDCKLQKPHTGLRIPPYSDQTNTLWWDLAKVTATHRSIAKAIMKENHIVGYQYRARSQWLELGYERDQHRDEALNKIVHIDERNALSPIAPRHILGNEIFIHLVNVPTRREDESRKLILPALKVFGRVKQIEPVRYKFTGLVTRRWNAILCIPWGTKLVMPSIMDIKGQRILAFWKGCEPACSTCMEGGHWQNQCTKKLQDEAEKKAQDRAQPAPLNPVSPGSPPKSPLLTTTPPQPSTSSSSSGSSPKPPLTKVRIPPPPPPASAKKSTSGTSGKGKGKSPAAMAQYLEKYAGQIRSFTKDTGLEFPTLEETVVGGKATEETPENGDIPEDPTVLPETLENTDPEGFTVYKSKRTQAKEKTAEKKAQTQVLSEEVQKARATRTAEDELQKKKKIGNREDNKRKATLTPFNSPSRKPSTPKRQTTEKKVLGRPRTKLEKDTYCFYAIQSLGRSKEHVEKVYNMNRQQWEDFRAKKIDGTTYNLAYDWGRSPKGRTSTFNPIEWGIKAHPVKSEDKIQESEHTSSSSLSESSDENKFITVSVRIVNPETEKEEKSKFAVPIGASVNYLKKLIAAKYSVELPDFQIYSRGKKLRKEKMGNEIKDRFYLNVFGNWEMEKETKVPEPAFKVVFVMDLQGKKLTFNIDPATTTEELIRMFAHRTNKVARQITLLFNNNVLKNGETLASAGIKNKDTVRVSPELKFVLMVRAVIDGDTQVKKIHTVSEFTLDVLRHDVAAVFGTLPAEYEFEKNGKILPLSQKIRESLFDGAIVSLRFKGTTSWDANKKEEEEYGQTSKDAPDNDNFVTLKYHNGIRWINESFSYRWTESTTFGAIRDYLSEHIADDKLQIKFNDKHYENDSTLKDADVELEDREVLVIAIQDDDYMASAEEDAAEPTNS
jgi:hypothetical protein